MAQILIIEDEALLAKSISRSLSLKGYDCITASSAEDGIRLLETTPSDVVLLDLQLPGMSGLEAIEHIRKIDPDIIIIMATAYGTMATVVEAMRAGASDFLRKPLDIEEVSIAIERGLVNAKLKQTISYYSSREAEKTDEDKLISNSPCMTSVVSIVEKIISMDMPKPSDHLPVLILGETGTGKDLIARIIHFRGNFSKQPFIEVNCSTFPRGLEEAELFGYEKGAFTGAVKSKRGLFEAASGGTIFLNEIGELALDAQAKLLQVIERKCLRRVGGLRDIPIDVRIIAATNRNLKDKSSFREDLYHRLNYFTIELPALRDRKEDVNNLSELFLRQSCIRFSVEKRLDKDAEKSLLNYGWPGNVRELRQLIERAVALTENPIITSADLNLPAKRQLSDDHSKLELSLDFSEDGIDLEETEKKLILAALKYCKGNISEAARKLNIGREALRYRIHKHNISKFIDIDG